MDSKETGIYKAINGVMQDVGAITKEKLNKQQGFNFRGIDDVMNALYPAMVKHKLFVVPEILEQIREERQTKSGGNLIYSICKIKYTFFAEDGSNVSAIVIGEGMDSGDKATNKAMSIAFKYACFQTFCIPTEENEDPDGECHKVESKKITPAMLATIKAEIERTGVKESTIIKLTSVKKLEDMSIQEFEKIMKRFQITPSKEATK